MPICHVASGASVIVYTPTHVVILEILKNPAPAPQPSSPNIKSVSPVPCLTASISTSKFSESITKNSAEINLAKPAKPSASACKLQEIFKINASPTPLTLSATPTCASAKSGNFANSNPRVRV